MMTFPNRTPRRPFERGLLRPAAPLAVFVAGSQLAFAQPRTERVEHAIEMPAGAIVTILNFAGHVEVHGTDPGEDRTLRVVGIKRLAAEASAEDAARIFAAVNLDLRRRGRRIHLGPSPRWSRGRPGGQPSSRPDRSREGPRDDTPVTEVRAPRRIPPVSVDLEIWLPDGASLEVRTFTAPITVNGIASPDGDFLLRSVSGPVHIRDLDARDLHAETVSGEVDLTNVRSERASFKTLTAAVRLRGVLPSEGAYEFHTHSGPVLLGLGSAAGFALAASTYTGEILNELTFEAHGDGRNLEGRHGDGEPDISVSTFSGPIHLTSEAAPIRAVER